MNEATLSTYGQHMRLTTRSPWLLLMLVVGLLVIAGVVQANLVSTGEEPATSWDGEHWLIMPLKEGDSAAYYEAHQSSARYLYNVLGWGWPTRKISPEVNLDMVRHHVSQQQAQYSFTYVVRARGERDIAGAIYINPVSAERQHIANFDAKAYGAELTFWFTEKIEASEHVDTLLSEIFTWLNDEWQFSAVLLPVNKNYSFIHQQMERLEYIAFSEDFDSGELLYRLP